MRKATACMHDTIDRAIRRGTGEESVNYEEITYEGYGPGGVALLVQSMTDNRNRTVAEIGISSPRTAGTLGRAGPWLDVSEEGYIVVDKAAKSEEELFDLAIEAGADDLRDDERILRSSLHPMLSTACWRR